MQSQIRRILAEQDGIIARPTAMALGMSSSAIGRLVDNGDWSIAARGVYMSADRPMTDRARLRVACARAGRDAVLSGAAAAWWQGVGERAPVIPRVTAPRGRNGRKVTGVRITHRGLQECDVVERSGLLVMALPLAVLEAAVHEGEIAVVDAALLRGRVSLRQLWAAHERYPNRHGGADARRMLNAAASGARSEAERVVVRLLRSVGISGWRANDPAHGYVGDLVFETERVIVEIDGWAFHSDAEAFQRDRTRQNDLVNAGWVVLRFTWGDETARPDYVVATIRRALQLRRSSSSR